MKYQFGSLRPKKRSGGKAAWEFRYYEEDAKGKRGRKSTIIGYKDELPNETAARRKVEALLLKLNKDTPNAVMTDPTVGALCDMFITEERLQEIKDTKPGEEVSSDGLSFESATGYLKIIRCYIRPKWGAVPIKNV